MSENEWDFPAFSEDLGDNFTGENSQHRRKFNAKESMFFKYTCDTKSEIRNVSLLNYLNVLNYFVFIAKNVLVFRNEYTK